MKQVVRGSVFGAMFFQFYSILKDTFVWFTNNSILINYIETQLNIILTHRQLH